MAEHGTRSAYNHDFCRCVACRAANAAYNRQNRRERYERFVKTGKAKAEK